MRVASSLLGVLLVLTIGSAISVATAAQSAEVAEAIEFRTDFGLNDDADLVAQSFQDDRYSNVAWGLPLTPAEAGGLFERVRYYERVMPLVEGPIVEAAGFAGVYFDQRDGGIAVFQFASHLDRARELITSALGGMDYRLERVAWSLADLQQTRRRITDNVDVLAEASVPVVSIGYDIRANRVLVGIDGDLDIARSLMKELGERVKFRRMDPPTMDVCIDLTQCPEAKGNIEIRDGTGFCTSGFMVKRTNVAPVRYFLLTAGHCAALTNGNNTWVHGANNLVVGDATHWIWQDQGPLPIPSNQGLPTDIALIRLAGAFTPDDKNDHLWTNANGIANVTSYATSILSHPVGTPVCYVGAGRLSKGLAPKKCGEVTVWAVDNYSCKGPGRTRPCALINLTMEVSFDTKGGDSGGGYWLGPSDNDPPHKAMGTVVHSTRDDLEPPSARKAWYTPINEALDALEDDGFDIAVCLAAGC